MATTMPPKATDYASKSLAELEQERYARQVAEGTAPAWKVQRESRPATKELRRRKMLEMKQKKQNRFKAEMGRALVNGQQYQGRKWTPELASDIAAIRGYDIPPTTFETYLPPSVQAERATGRVAVGQAAGMLTQEQIAANRAAEAERDRLARQGLLNTEANSKYGVAKLETGAELGVAKIEADAGLDIARMTGEQQIALQEGAETDPRLPLQQEAARAGVRDIHRQRALQSAGVESIKSLNETMAQVAGERGSPGAFGIGKGADIARAKSVIHAYRNLVSDPEFGREFAQEFEANPIFQEFIAKINSWGMGIDILPPATAGYIPGRAI